MPCKRALHLDGNLYLYTQILILSANIIIINEMETDELLIIRQLK